jgi:abortive infection bacteriophage resistance protein
LVLSELEKIEVAIRAQMIYTLLHNHGAFWFNEFPLFTDPNKLKSSRGKMLIEYNRSDEEFVKAFKRKYSELLPPSWMILEISSFGILSNLFSNLKPGRNKREIASYFGLDDRTFESWMHTFTYIRNVCAHHARLWNKIFSISPKIPRSPRHQFLNTTSIIHPTNGETIYLNQKTYYLCSVLIYVLDTVNPKHSFHKKLNRLFVKYPIIDVKAMGFPSNWEQEPLWNWKNAIK